MSGPLLGTRLTGRSGSVLLVLTVLSVGIAACTGGVVAQNSTEAVETNQTVDPNETAESTVPYPSNPDNVSTITFVTARLSAGSDGRDPIVDFTGGNPPPTVQSISFRTEPVETVVRVAEYRTVPSVLDSPDAEVIHTVEILVPPSLADTNATITASVDRQAIPDARSDEDLMVLRRADGDWQPLETTVVDSTPDDVVIEAATPGFSYFTIVAHDGTVDPTTIEQEVGPPDNQSTTTTDESPTLGIGGVIGAIVLTSLLLARRSRRH